MYTKQGDWLFIILPIGIIVNMFLGWSVMEFLTPDSQSYIEIAKNLPVINNSLFPILYPIVLRILNFFTTDYFIAYKLLNFFVILFIIVFVKIKNFYWKEIWTILTFASFQNIYCYAWSEMLILLLIVALCYINKSLLLSNQNNKFFIIQSVFILTLMFLTKYSSIFFAFSYLGYSIYLFLIKDKKKSLLYFKTFLLVNLLFTIYLFINKYNTGMFTGPRGNVFYEMSFVRYILLSAINIPISLTPASLSFIKILYQPTFLYSYSFLWKIPPILSSVILIYLLYKSLKLKLIINSKYLMFLLFCSFSFLLFSFISAYYTKIDVLSSRLLLGFYSFFLIGIIHFLKLNKIKLSDISLLAIGMYSIICYGLSIFYNGYVITS